jgi:hypothetical protein
MAWGGAAPGQYRLTVVADYPAQPTVFMQSPPINDHGAIVVMPPSREAPYYVGGLSLLTLKGRAQPIAAPGPGLDEARGHSLNNRGEVSYIEPWDGAVYRADGRGRVLVAEPEGDPEFRYFAPAINQDGDVAVAAELDKDGNTALFLYQRGEWITVSDSEKDPLNFHGPPDVNRDGHVVFGAYDAAALRNNIYLYRRGRVEQVYENGFDPSINDHDEIAFTRFGPMPGDSVVLRGRGGQPVVIAASGPALLHPAATGINQHGQVVLRATLPDAAQAVFVGDGERLTRIVAGGDVISGRTVAAVSPPAINDHGEVALEVRFTDNSAAVVRASSRE